MTDQTPEQPYSDLGNWLAWSDDRFATIMMEGAGWFVALRGDDGEATGTGLTMEDAIRAALEGSCS